MVVVRLVNNEEEGKKAHVVALLRAGVLLLLLKSANRLLFKKGEQQRVAVRKSMHNHHAVGVREDCFCCAESFWRILRKERERCVAWKKSVHFCWWFVKKKTTDTEREREREKREKREKRERDLSITAMLSSTTKTTTTTQTQTSYIRRKKITTAANSELKMHVREEEKEEHRTMCYSCFRRENLCICKLCERVLLEKTRSKEKLVLKDGLHVSILQDRDEFRRKLGSAHIARNIVENCDVVWRDCSWPNALTVPKLEVPLSASTAVTEEFDGDEGHEEYEMVVLWPSEDAISIKEYKNRNLNKKKTHMVVLDSTWYKARRMYNRIPWLKDLPSISLQNIENESMYKPIRKQPFRDALSTAESIALALKEFGNEDAELVNIAFSEMIREQLEEEKRHDRDVRSRAVRARERRNVV